MKLIPLIASLVLAGVLSGCNGQDVRIEFVQSTATNSIASGYQTLFENADQLLQTSDQCKLQEADQPRIIVQLKTHWRRTMAAWQSVQWVQFGPIKEGGREWSLQFWPDKKNLVGTKVNGLMRNNKTITQDDIARGGVLTQGLSAMEYILFDRLEQSITKEKGRRAIFMHQACLSSRVIAQAIKNTSQVLLDDWASYYRQNLKQLHKPNADADIVDVQQALSLIVNNMMTSIELMQNRKLGSAFALSQGTAAKASLNASDAKKANPFFLESWRSHSSRDNLDNNIQTLLKLLTDKSFTSLLAAKQQEKLALRLKASSIKIATMLAATKKSPSYFEQLSASKLDAAKNIKSLYQELGRLKLLVAKDLVSALDIQAGFNANDGDS